MYGYYQQQPQIIGSLAKANTYAEIQTAPVPVNGSPTMFLVENENAVYLVAQQGNQRTIQGFKITPLPTQQEATENRISNLEAAIMDIKNLLNGGNSNESNTAGIEQIPTTAGTE